MKVGVTLTGEQGNKMFATGNITAESMDYVCPACGKPTVHHRVDISEIVGCGNFSVNGQLIPKKAKVFAEWND